MTGSMEDMLSRVRDGWTVKARFKTRDGHVVIEGVVRADEKSRWYGIGVPGWATDPHLLVPLCQITGSLPNGDLVEVISASPPPVYTNASVTEYGIGDEIEDVDGNRWTAVRNLHDTQGHPEADVVFLPTSGIVGSRAEEHVTRALVGPLKLVGRVQPWPVKVVEVDEVFATAQRQIVKQIRDMTRKHMPTDVAYRELDEAARVVERYNLDDAYPDPVGYSDTWQ
jgi:hypothetical protein